MPKKPILAASLASGLALALAACDTTFAPTPGSIEGADLTAWSYAPLYDGLRLDDLLDEDVVGPGGASIGELEDVIIGANGRAEAIIVEADGFLEIGDTHFRVPWNEVEIAAGADVVTVPVTPGSVEDYALFEGEYVPKQPREWRATELIGDYAILDGGIGYGYVDDLVISRAGDLEAVVVMPDVAYGIYQPYAFPFYGYPYGYDPGPGYYELPYAEDDIAALEPFDYAAFD